MRKLTRDEIKALQNGQLVYVKLTRLYWPKAQVEYEGLASLYVQRHPKTNEIVEMTPTERPSYLASLPPIEISWAGYDPRRCFETDDSLVTEDWQMEIFEDGS